MDETQEWLLPPFDGPADQDDAALLESSLLDVSLLLDEAAPLPADAPTTSISSMYSDTMSSLTPPAPVIKQEHKRSNQSNQPNSQKRRSSAIKDEETKESKKQRRLVRNRMSAQLHRERKKAQLTNLETQLKAKTGECESLKSQVSELKIENAALRLRLEQFSGNRNIQDAPPASSSGEITPPFASSCTDDAEDSSMSDISSSPSSPYTPPQNTSSIGAARGTMLFSIVLSCVIFADPGMQDSMGRGAAAVPAIAPPSDVSRTTSNALVPHQSYKAAPAARVLASVHLNDNDLSTDTSNLEIPWAVDKENQLQLYPHDQTVIKELNNNDTLASEASQSKSDLVNAASRAAPSSKALRGKGGSKSMASSLTTELVQNLAQSNRNSTLPDFASPTTPEHGDGGSYIFCPEAFGSVNIWTGEAAVSEFSRRAAADTKAPGAVSGIQSVAEPGVQQSVDNSRALMPIKKTEMSYPRVKPTTSAEDSSSDAGQSAYMLMLVPTHSVQWGGRSLHNSTAEDGDADDESDDASTWLEIGCEVLHARVVSHVQFSAM